MPPTSCRWLVLAVLPLCSCYAAHERASEVADEYSDAGAPSHARCGTPRTESFECYGTIDTILTPFPLRSGASIVAPEEPETFPEGMGIYDCAERGRAAGVSVVCGETPYSNPPDGTAFLALRALIGEVVVIELPEPTSEVSLLAYHLGDFGVLVYLMGIDEGGAVLDTFMGFAATGREWSENRLLVRADGPEITRVAIAPAGAQVLIDELSWH